MTKEQNKIVPRLRFPEFNTDGEWEEKILGEIGEFIGGGTPDTSVAEYWDGEIQWFTPSEIKEKNIYKSLRTITETGLKNSSAKLLPVGTLLITTRATIGDVGIANLQCTTNQGFQSFIVKDLHVNVFWYYWIIQNKDEIKRKSSGSTFPEISKNEIGKINAFYPGKIEQQKIAACLSSLDEIIVAEAEKLAQLKAHKKGLMQNLFPAEGETLPKLRFPEFRDSGEWMFEPFPEVYSFKSTNTLSRENLNYEGGYVKNIHYGDIHTKFLTLFDITKETVPFINPAITLEKVNPESYCIEGDIIFADASEDLKDVGKAIELVNLDNERLLSGMHTLLARQKILKITVGFAGYLFMSSKIRSQIQREAQGTKIFGISTNRFANIQIYYPKQTDEQQKIASCLSSLDDQIAHQSEKIETLKQHKKGLMQQLFPNVNDIN